jgi:signal transduction histidine kinase
MQSPHIPKTNGTGNRQTRKFSVFWIAVLSGMASLLTVVAVLQYRWTKQLSKATEASIGSNLQPLMTGWDLDFYGEFSAICVALQVGPDSGARETWDDYLHRYVDWSHAATNNDSLENIYANPDVVRKVYIWETSDKTRPRLLALNPDSREIEDSTVPDYLKTLLTRLRAKSSSLTLALRAWKISDSSAETPYGGSNQLSPSASLRTDKVTGWQFDASIPAIVHPIVHSGRHSPNPSGEHTTSEHSVDWIVVVLDVNTIQKRILPSLTKRYFGGRGGLEYKLAVVATGKSPRLIYSSDPGFPSSNGGEVDSEMNIFGPPPESVEGHFWQTIKNSESLRPEEWRNFSAPVWFPVIQYGSQDEPWTLLLQHRTGPLETIATSIWHKNFMTGGIVLLLLTVDLGLILIASRRAQKLAKLQLDFVASISHEFLTPLAAIYCTGQNAKDGLVQTKSDLIAHGSIITSQARGLIDLIKQNLLFAASESGMYRIVLYPLEVSEILQSFGKNVATLIEESGCTMEYTLEARLPKVMGDPSALTHCLQNLIGNAIKYSGKNAWIGISASLHDVGKHSKEVRISVQDHGPGISSSELRNIFKPFYRSPQALESQIHGTGLGLTVAERIAQAMGGRLSVTSELGVGSIFTLHLPVHEEDAELQTVSPGRIDTGIQQ